MSGLGLRVTGVGLKVYNPYKSKPHAEPLTPKPQTTPTLPVAETSQLFKGVSTEAIIRTLSILGSLGYTVNPET